MYTVLPLRQRVLRDVSVDLQDANEVIRLANILAPVVAQTIRERGGTFMHKQESSSATYVVKDDGDGVQLLRAGFNLTSSPEIAPARLFHHEASELFEALGLLPHQI